MDCDTKHDRHCIAFFYRRWQQTQKTVPLFSRQQQHCLRISEIQSPRALNFNLSAELDTGLIIELTSRRGVAYMRGVRLRSRPLTQAAVSPVGETLRLPPATVHLDCCYAPPNKKPPHLRARAFLFGVP
jgi:hypothetical protein